MSDNDCGRLVHANLEAGNWMAIGRLWKIPPSEAALEWLEFVAEKAANREFLKLGEPSNWRNLLWNRLTGIPDLIERLDGLLDDHKLRSEIEQNIRVISNVVGKRCEPSTKISDESTTEDLMNEATLPSSMLKVSSDMMKLDVPQNPAQLIWEIHAWTGESQEDVVDHLLAMGIEFLITLKSDRAGTVPIRESIQIRSHAISRICERVETICETIVRVHISCSQLADRMEDDLLLREIPRME